MDAVKKVRAGVARLPSGIHGLDLMLGGGLPKGRSVLVVGGSGTGKSVLLSEFLYKGAVEFDEAGIFVTFEETPADIMKNMNGFGWNFERLVKSRKLAFVDASPYTQSSEEVIGEEYSLSPLLERVKDAVMRLKAKRVVIDGLSTLFERFSNRAAVRQVLCEISAELKRFGVTCLMSTAADSRLGHSEVAEYVADGVMELSTRVGENQIVRRLLVLKLRGLNFRSGNVSFDISGKGIAVYPKIPIEKYVEPTLFSTLLTLGDSGIDSALGGGVPQGHILLFGGNTGCGKTTLGMQFLIEGLKLGEKVVYVTVEEPIVQAFKTALEHGWDFEKYQKKGLLKVIAPGMIDVFTDRLLYDVLDAIDSFGAKRILFDSVSSLVSGSMNRDDVRQFLLTLVALLKSRGVTAVFTYLAPQLFGGSSSQKLANIIGTEMRLSSFADGVLLARYIELGGVVKKAFTVLKLRGRPHSTDIFECVVDASGFRVLKQFK